LFEIRSQCGILLFSLPAAFDAVVVKPVEEPEPIVDPASAIEREIRDSFRENSAMLKGASSVAVCVTDMTRKCHDSLFLGSLLSVLEESGFGPERVRLVVAQGLHRPMSQAEKVSKYGSEVVSRYKVSDHDAIGGVVNLGKNGDDFPVEVNRSISECDVVLSTGVVELHQYAGYSGGTKTVGIGCAGSKTIAYTHSPAMVLDDRVRIGKTRGNPFRKCVNVVAERARNVWCVNELFDSSGNVCSESAGHPVKVLEKLASFSEKYFTVNCGRKFDLAIAGVPYPKGVNLYQSSRVATYLALAESPILKEGAPIILHAPCPEGVGLGSAEKAFFELLSRNKPEVLIEMAASGDWKGGEQRALVVARAMISHPIIVSGTPDRELVEACRMTWSHDVETAAGIARDKFGSGRETVIIPDPFTILPVCRVD